MNRKQIHCLIIAVLIVSSFVSYSLYAEEKEKNWEIRNYQTIRLDTRKEEDHTYLTRIECPLHYSPFNEFDITLELKPFAETQYFWKREEWRRTETGAEAGFRITKWAYIGESFHYAWLKENKDTSELETRLEMDIPFVLNFNGGNITLRLIEEYTYALEERKATRNEIAANFVIPAFKYLDCICGWRHIDRIHDYDSDQVELSIVFRF